jgi:hypothetical protein
MFVVDSGVFVDVRFLASRKGEKKSAFTSLLETPSTMFVIMVIKSLCKKELPYALIPPKIIV